MLSTSLLGLVAAAASVTATWQPHDKKAGAGASQALSSSAEGSNSTVGPYSLAPSTSSRGPLTSTLASITTEVIYTTVTSCPVTKTIKSGTTQAVVVVTDVSTVRVTDTQTICHKCTATTPTMSSLPTITSTSSPSAGLSSSNTNGAVFPSSSPVSAGLSSSNTNGAVFPTSSRAPSAGFSSPLSSGTNGPLFPITSTGASSGLPVKSSGASSGLLLSTAHSITTEVVYDTVTSCPVTSTISQGSSRAVVVTTELSTVRVTETQTICHVCTATTPALAIPVSSTNSNGAIVPSSSPSGSLPSGTIPSTSAGRDNSPIFPISSNGPSPVLSTGALVPSSPLGGTGVSASPAASTAHSITTEVVYDTVTTCPVTSTYGSGPTQSVIVTSAVSTIRVTETQTICHVCTATTPGLKSSVVPVTLGTGSATPVAPITLGTGSATPIAPGASQIPPFPLSNSPAPASSGALPGSESPVQTSIYLSESGGVTQTITTTIDRTHTQTNTHTTYVHPEKTGQPENSPTTGDNTPATGNTVPATGNSTYSPVGHSPESGNSTNSPSGNSPATGNSQNSPVGSSPASGNSQNSPIGSSPATGNSTNSPVGSSPASGNSQNSPVGSSPATGNSTNSPIGGNSGNSPSNSTTSPLSGTSNNSPELPVTATHQRTSTSTKYVQPSSSCPAPVTVTVQGPEVTVTYTAMANRPTNGATSNGASPGNAASPANGASSGNGASPANGASSGNGASPANGASSGNGATPGNGSPAPYPMGGKNSTLPGSSGISSGISTGLPTGMASSGFKTKCKITATPTEHTQVKQPSSTGAPITMAAAYRF